MTEKASLEVEILTADGVRNLDKVKKEFKDLDKHVEKSHGLLKGLFTIEAARAGIDVLRAGAGAVRQIYAAGVEAQRAWDGLGVGLKARGGDLAAVRKEVEAFADAMSHRKAVADEGVVSVLNDLVRYGYDLPKAMEQVPFVLDVAARWHLELADAAEHVGKTFQGDLGAAEELGIAFRKVGNEAGDARNLLEAMAKESSGAHDAIVAKDPGLRLALSMERLRMDMAERVRPEVDRALEGIIARINGMDPKTLEDFGKSTVTILKAVADAALATGQAMAWLESRRPETISGAESAISLVASKFNEHRAASQRKAAEMTQDPAARARLLERADQNEQMARAYGRNVNRALGQRAAEVAARQRREAESAEEQKRREAAREAEAARAVTLDRPDTSTLSPVIAENDLIRARQATAKAAARHMEQQRPPRMEVVVRDHASRIIVH